MVTAVVLFDGVIVQLFNTHGTWTPLNEATSPLTLIDWLFASCTITVTIVYLNIEMFIGFSNSLLMMVTFYGMYPNAVTGTVEPFVGAIA
jgi:hypothetical protein